MKYAAYDVPAASEKERRAEISPAVNGPTRPVIKSLALSSARRPDSADAADDFVQQWVMAGKADPGQHPRDKRDRRGSPLRVLIADDYPDSAESLALFLTAAGCDTQIAHDGAEALARASAWHPHVCVLDLRMPKLDGCEIARQVRKHAWARNCLLIAVTGWTAAEYRHEAGDAGFDFYFRKPVEPGELLRVVRRHAS
jgi:CheY-like chemotaxis protein